MSDTPKRFYQNSKEHCRQMGMSMMTIALQIKYKNISGISTNNFWLPANDKSLTRRSSCPYSDHLYGTQWTIKNNCYDRNRRYGRNLRFRVICVAEAKWNNWSAWGECDETCGKGNKQRTRTCPTGAVIGQAGCIGNTTDSATCTGLDCRMSI